MSLFVKYKCQSAEGSHSRAHFPCGVNIQLFSSNAQKNKSPISGSLDYYLKLRKVCILVQLCFHNVAMQTMHFYYFLSLCPVDVFFFYSVSYTVYIFNLPPRSTHM